MDRKNIPASAFGSYCSNDPALSFWRAETEQDLEEIQIALSSGFNAINTLTLCIIDEEKLAGLNLTIAEEEDTSTPYKKAAKKHVNVSGFNFETYVNFIKLLWNEANIELIQPNELKAKIKKAIDNGEIALEKLKSELKCSPDFNSEYQLLLQSGATKMSMKPIKGIKLTFDHDDITSSHLKDAKTMMNIKDVWSYYEVDGKKIRAISHETGVQKLMSNLQKALIKRVG